MPFLSASCKCTKPAAPAAQETGAGKALALPGTSSWAQLVAKCSWITRYLPGSSLRRGPPQRGQVGPQRGKVRGGGSDGKMGLLADDTVTLHGLKA